MAIYTHLDRRTESIWEMMGVKASKDPEVGALSAVQKIRTWSRPSAANRRFWLWPFVALGVLQISGCATLDDLDALKVDMTRSMNAAKREMKAQIEMLQRENKASSEETKKWLEDQRNQLAGQLKVQQDAVAMLADVEKDYKARLAEHAQMLRAQQDTVNRLSEEVKGALKDTADLRAALQSEQGMVFAVLDAEETLYKEGLRSVQSLRSELIRAKGRSRSSEIRKDVESFEEGSIGRRNLFTQER